MINNKLRQIENIFIASFITIALVTGYLIISEIDKKEDNKPTTTVTTYKIIKK